MSVPGFQLRDVWAPRRAAVRIHAATGAAGWRGHLARHAPLIAALLAAAALRAITTLAYWPGLELDWDSMLYLGHAAALTPGTWHPFGYSLFLEVLSPLGSLGVVTVVQHVLGLALAVAIYALLLRVRVRPWLAALATLPVLLDGYQLDIEQFILSETLVDALLVAGLAVLAWRERIGPAWAVLVGLLLAGATLTRVAAAPALLVAGLYLLARRRWAAVGTYTAVVLACLLGYGAWYGATYGSFGYSDYGGVMEYARVAPFASCRYPLPAGVARLCPAAPVATRTASTEFYTWDPRSPLYARGLGTQTQRNALATRFFRAVVEHQPLAYAEHVAGDIAHFFAPGRWMTSSTIELARYRFPTADENPYRNDLHVEPASIGFDERPITAHPRPSLFSFLRAYQGTVYTQGPLLLALLVAGVAAALGLGRRRARRRQARWVAALFSLTGLLIIVVPSLTTAFSYRSGLPLLVLLPPGGIVAADLAVDAVIARRRRDMPAAARESQGGRARPEATEVRTPVHLRNGQVA